MAPPLSVASLRLNSESVMVKFEVESALIAPPTRPELLVYSQSVIFTVLFRKSDCLLESKVHSSSARVVQYA